MNRSTPGLPVHHQLPQFTQTHVHRVSETIQPSHPLSSPSPPAPNPFQHQSFPMSQLFAWGGQSTGVSALASFLPKKSQGWSPSEWTGWISLQSKGLPRLFNTTVQKHQFFGAQPSSRFDLTVLKLQIIVDNNIYEYIVYRCKRLWPLPPVNFLCFLWRKLMVYAPLWKQSFQEQSMASMEILSTQIMTVLFWYVLILFCVGVVLPLSGVPKLDNT